MNDSKDPRPSAPADAGEKQEPEPNPDIEPPPFGYISKGYHPNKPNPLPRVREADRKPQKK